GPGAKTPESRLNLGSSSQSQDTESRQDPRTSESAGAEPAGRAPSPLIPGSFLWKTAAFPGPRGRERNRHRNGGSETERERGQAHTHSHTHTHTHTLSDLFIQQHLFGSGDAFTGCRRVSHPCTTTLGVQRFFAGGGGVLCPGGWSDLGLHPLDAEAPSRVRTRGRAAERAQGARLAERRVLATRGLLRLPSARLSSSGIKAGVSGAGTRTGRQEKGGEVCPFQRAFLSAQPSGPEMPLSVRLLLLAVLLSLAETPASAPVHGGRGGWTLNSAGYLLGPVLSPPPRVDRGRKKTTLGILDLWRAIDGLPYSQSLRASRSLGETTAKAEIGDPGVLGQKVLKEEDALGS
uniref:Galanin-like peptide n=1 Tax=Capra hircus TaxID=9925 RepID=A0A8C2P2J2_CAPHI